MFQNLHSDTPPLEKTDAFRIIQALREKIASNEAPPGSKLVEQDLSQELGVSRTVIRNALLILEERGLIIRIKNRGAYVARYSYEQVLRLWEVRENITVLAYQLAARRAPDNSWNEMRERFGEAMKTVVENEDTRGFADAVIELDELVMVHAENEFLRPILTPLMDMSMIVLNRRLLALPGRLEQEHEQNRAIVEALHARDEHEIAAIYREMIDSAQQCMKKYRDILF